jgi:hypothetical protein
MLWKERCEKAAGNQHHQQLEIASSASS